MNIFVVDADPTVSGTVLCDQHIIKMVLETAQLLSTAVHLYGGDAPYKPTHINHPCSVWTRSSYDHFIWLCSHGDAIAWEYRARYGKRHKSHDAIKHCRKVGRWLMPRNGWTPQPLCMPDEYKTDSVVQSYRNYYIGNKSRFATWKQNQPDWWRS